MQTSYHHLSYYHKYSKETFVMMNVRILFLLFWLVFRHEGIKTLTSRTSRQQEDGLRVDEASQLVCEVRLMRYLFLRDGCRGGTVDFSE